MSFNLIIIWGFELLVVQFTLGIISLQGIIDIGVIVSLWLLFSPSGDLGIGLIWDNHLIPIHPTPYNFLVWELKSSSTELNYLWWVFGCSQDDVRCFQMFLRCFQMFHRCSQMFSGCFQFRFETTFSPKFNNFFQRVILTKGMDILTMTMTMIKHYS